MKKLVYKFVTTFNPEFFNSGINYLCKDNYIHCRLNNYGEKKQKISGFEDKLSFLLTFMMNEVVNNDLSISKMQFGKDKKNYQEVWNHCLELLKLSNEYKALEFTLQEVFPNLKGIKILPVYSLKHKPTNAFDLIGSCKNIVEFTTLTYLLKFNLKDDLYGFLFNDKFEIIVDKESTVDNSKFINKYATKEKKRENDLLNLWEC